MPSDIKFKDGTLKKVLMDAMGNLLPESILNRKDKMGFPAPWRPDPGGTPGIHPGHLPLPGRKGAPRYFNAEAIIQGLSEESRFGRKI